MGVLHLLVVMITTQTIIGEACVYCSVDDFINVKPNLKLSSATLR